MQRQPRLGGRNHFPGALAHPLPSFAMNPSAVTERLTMHRSPPRMKASDPPKKVPRVDRIPGARFHPSAEKSARMAHHGEDLGWEGRQPTPRPGQPKSRFRSEAKSLPEWGMIPLFLTRGHSTQTLSARTRDHPGRLEEPAGPMGTRNQRNCIRRPRQPGRVQSGGTSNTNRGGNKRGMAVASKNVSERTVGRRGRPT